MQDKEKSIGYLYVMRWIIECEFQIFCDTHPALEPGCVKILSLKIMFPISSLLPGKYQEIHPALQCISASWNLCFPDNNEIMWPTRTCIKVKSCDHLRGTGWKSPQRANKTEWKLCPVKCCRRKRLGNDEDIGNAWRYIFPLVSQLNWVGGLKYALAVCSVVCCLHCTVYWAVCSVQCAVCSVQCELCSVQWSVCSVQSTVCSILFCRILWVQRTLQCLVINQSSPLWIQIHSLCATIYFDLQHSTLSLLGAQADANNDDDEFQEWWRWGWWHGQLVRSWSMQPSGEQKCSHRGTNVLTHEYKSVDLGEQKLTWFVLIH